MNKSLKFKISLLMLTIMGCTNAVIDNTSAPNKSGYNQNYGLKSNCYTCPTPLLTPTPTPLPTPTPTPTPLPTPTPRPVIYENAKYLDKLSASSNAKNRDITDRVYLTKKKIAWMRDIYLNKVPKLFSTKVSATDLGDLDGLDSRLKYIAYAQGCKTYYDFKSTLKIRFTSPISGKKSEIAPCDPKNALLPEQLGSAGFSVSSTDTSSIKDDILELKPFLDRLRILQAETTALQNEIPRNSIFEKSLRDQLFKTYSEIDFINKSPDFRSKNDLLINKRIKLGQKSIELVDKANKISDNFFDDSAFIQVPQNLDDVKNNIDLADGYFDDYISSENTYDLVTASRVVGWQYKALNDIAYGYMNGFISDLDPTTVSNAPDYPLYVMSKVIDVIQYLENNIKANELKLKSQQIKLQQILTDANNKVRDIRKSLLPLKAKIYADKAILDNDDPSKFNFSIQSIPYQEFSVTPGSEAEPELSLAATNDSLLGQAQANIGQWHQIITGLGNARKEAQKLLENANTREQAANSQAKINQIDSNISDAESRLEAANHVKEASNERAAEITKAKDDITTEKAKFEKSSKPALCKDGIYKTPSGRTLSAHAYEESLQRHGFKPPYKEIDDIIENYSRKTTQIKSGTVANVYIKKQSNRKYSAVIENSTDGTIVTAVKDFEKDELRRMGRRNGFNLDP